MTIVLIITLVLAAVPCALSLWNMALYRPPPSPIRNDSGKPPKVSVLIPARNEEDNIREAIRAVLANEGVTLEVLVLNDASEDRTVERVREIEAIDSRVRLLNASPLPDGWCGKQHACAQLAELATHDLFVFLDADVRLASDALARMAEFMAKERTDLASGIPRQVTGTWMEKLLLPLMHFLLLGYLPFIGMRLTNHPMFAAACGQLFIIRRKAYEQSGGHGSIRRSRHDGLSLPRSFRRSGFRTGLFDATAAASCRMYHSAAQVWEGLMKNATEGMASWGAIGPMSVLMFGGQVLPFLLAPWVGSYNQTGARLLVAAICCAWMPRLLQAFRYRLSILGALAHPLGVSVFLVIQWVARLRAAGGRPSSWKGRAYSP